MSSSSLHVLELFSGAGGMSYGLEVAGFQQALSIDFDADAVATVRRNRPFWNVLNDDVRNFRGSNYRDIDLLAAGVPSSPFSIAGQRLGASQASDLLLETLRLIEQVKPSAIILENVSGLGAARFREYRTRIVEVLEGFGYFTDWRKIQAFEYGLPQMRPRLILVALLASRFRLFDWPAVVHPIQTVGQLLLPSMSADGWLGADAWSKRANGIAPTIVGGSRTHGGADLGPTRSKQAWLALGVDGRGVSDAPPGADAPISLLPRLTNQMVAKIQGFDDAWIFEGKKTSVYRQIGNASPPPVFASIGSAIARALRS